MPAMAASSNAPLTRVGVESDPPINNPSGKPTTPMANAMLGRPKGQSAPALQRGDVKRRDWRSCARPRMASTVGTTRASAGASKNGIADTPAIPAMIEPGKI